MKMKYLASVVLPLFLCGVAYAQGTIPGSVSPDDKGGTLGTVYASQKVVYHIDENTKFKMLIGNVRNHLNAFEGVNANLDIVVLANGQGFGFLLKEGNSLGLDNPWASDVLDLASRGVVFEICNNTMHGHNIEKSDLLPVVNIVPAGVATLTELQMRGYAYLKP